MSKAIIDEQSLTDIADAIRAKNGSADTYTPSEMATAITDLPTPTPVTKGLVFSDYDSDGYPHKAEFVGSWTEIPQYLFQGIFGGTDAKATQFTSQINELNIPSTVTSIGNYAFDLSTLLTTINLPPALTTIGTRAFNGSGVTSLIIPSTVTSLGSQCFQNIKAVSVVFSGHPPTISSGCFNVSNKVMLYDFSNATSVPSLFSVASLGHANGCVIKVPQSLLSTWQTSTNWIDLQNVTWQGV